MTFLVVSLRTSGRADHCTDLGARDFNRSKHGEQATRTRAGDYTELLYQAEDVADYVREQDAKISLRTSTMVRWRPIGH